MLAITRREKQQNQPEHAVPFFIYTCSALGH